MLDKQILRGHVDRKFPRSPDSICDISHVEKTDKSNCCSHETLFHKVTCELKRLDAVNYALNSGVRKTIDLPDKVPSSGLEATFQFHEEQFQHFAFSILLCPVQLAPQIILSELQILLESSITFVFKEDVNVSLFGRTLSLFI